MKEVRTLEDAINESRVMLTWEADWDGEGAEAYSLDTWTRMASLLRALAQTARSSLQFEIPIPDIGPAEHGGIEMFWELPDKRLLITVPAQRVTADQILWKTPQRKNDRRAMFNRRRFVTPRTMAHKLDSNSSREKVAKASFSRFFY